MSESRQQQRARERAEGKAAARAAASPGGPVERPVRGYTIEVHRTEFDEQDEDDGVWWGAEAGLTGNSVGYDYESREDLAELLAEVVHDARAKWGSRLDLRLEWSMTEWSDSSVSLTEAAAAVGFELPDRLDGP